MYVLVHMGINGLRFTQASISRFPDRTAVYLQCPAVHTADTLQYMECICIGGCKYTSDTLQSALQSQCSLQAAHTANTLHVHCMCTPVQSGFYQPNSTLNRCMGNPAGTERRPNQSWTNIISVQGRTNSEPILWLDPFGDRSAMVHIRTYASVHILVQQNRSWIKNACREAYHCSWISVVTSYVEQRLSRLSFRLMQNCKI